MLADWIVVLIDKAKQSVHVGPRDIFDLFPDHFPASFAGGFQIVHEMFFVVFVGMPRVPVFA